MSTDAAEGNDNKPGLLAQIQQLIDDDRKKWGGMSLEAHARLGLSELREIFNPGGNIAQQTPYGMYGAQTPGEVANSRRVDEPQSLEQEPMANSNEPLPSPSEIAGLSPEAKVEMSHGQGLGNEGNAAGSVYGESLAGGKADLPSPSEIAENTQAASPEPNHGLDQGQQRGGRGM